MDSPGGQTDAELLAATGSDPEAFGRFYDRYEAAVVGYFLRRTAAPDVAADLTAEVFADALAAAARYRPEGPTAAVIGQIVALVVRDTAGHVVRVSLR